MINVINILEAFQTCHVDLIVKRPMFPTKALFFIFTSIKLNFAGVLNKFMSVVGEGGRGISPAPYHFF